eukprot:679415-Rhodomonas_salina.1
MWGRREGSQKESKGEKESKSERAPADKDDMWWVIGRESAGGGGREGAGDVDSEASFSRAQSNGSALA